MKVRRKNIVEKSIDCVEEKLIINKPLLQMYGHFIKIECNDIILYEGEIEKYNSIDIKANNSICRINLYIMVDGDYLFFDKYFIQKNPHRLPFPEICGDCSSL